MANSNAFVVQVNERHTRLLALLSRLSDHETPRHEVQEIVQNPLLSDIWTNLMDFDQLNNLSSELFSHVEKANMTVLEILESIAIDCLLPRATQHPDNSQLDEHDDDDLHNKLKGESGFTMGTYDDAHFVELNDETASFVESLLAFVFVIINDCGDDKRLENHVDLQRIAKLTSSYLYVLDLKVSWRASRCFTQAVGLLSQKSSSKEEYYPPLEIIDLLRCMSTCVWFNNGSVPYNERLGLKEYLNLQPDHPDFDYFALHIHPSAQSEDRVSKSPRKVGNDESSSRKIERLAARLHVSSSSISERGSNGVLTWESREREMYAVAQYNLKRTIFSAGELRPYLLSQQIYAQAALMILLGPAGYDHAVLDQAPKALSVLLDLCREPALEGSALVKTSIIEATTMMLSFSKDLSPYTAIHKWKLAPLLAALFTKNLDPAYFHQLCDLSSFMPSSMQATMLPPLVELTNDQSLPLRSRCRILTTASRSVYLSELPVQLITPLFDTLITGFKNDFDHLQMTGGECDPDGELRRLIQARMMFPAFGLHCPSCGAEWERLIIGSKLPEIFAALLKDRTLVKFFSPKILETIVEIFALVSTNTDVRFLLLTDRGLGGIILEGAFNLCELTLDRSTSYSWRCLWMSLWYLFSPTDDITPERPSTSDNLGPEQFVDLWKSVLFSLQACIKRLLSDNEGRSGGVGIPGLEDGQNLDSMEDQDEPDSIIPDPFGDKNKTSTSRRKKDGKNYLEVQYAGLLFQLANKLGIQTKDDLIEYAENMTKLVMECPVPVYFVRPIVVCLINDASFMRDIYIPRAVMSTSQTLMSIIDNVDQRWFTDARIITHKLVWESAIPAMKLNVMEPIARVVSIKFFQDRSEDSENQKKWLESTLDADQLRNLLFSSLYFNESDIMDYKLTNIVTSYLQKSDSIAKLTWWTNWLKLLAQREAPEFQPKGLKVLDTGLIDVYDEESDKDLSREESSISVERRTLDDAAIEFFRTAFDMMILSSQGSNFRNLGINIWNAISDFVRANSTYRGFKRAMKELTTHLIPETTLLFVKHRGFEALNHPMVKYSTMSILKVCAVQYNDDHLDSIIRSNPQTAESAFLSLIKYWLPDHSIELFDLWTRRVFDETISDREFWLDFVHKSIMNVPYRSLDGYISLRNKIVDFVMEFFSGIIAEGKIFSPSIFQAWRDLWLWSNYPSRMDEYAHDAVPETRPSFPSFKDQMKFLTVSVQVVQSMNDGINDADQAYKELGSLLWINSLFAMNTVSYRESLLESGLITLSLKLSDSIKPVTSPFCQTIGHIISDMMILTPGNVAAQVYNNLNSRAQYGRPTLENLPIFNDVRLDLSEIVSKVIPASVVWVGEQNGSKQLYTWHVVDKAMEKLDLLSQKDPNIESIDSLSVQNLTTLRTFIDSISRCYMESPNTKGVTSLSTLVHLVRNSGCARDIVVDEHKDTISKSLLAAGLGFVTTDPRTTSRSNDQFVLETAQQFLIALMRKSNDEAYSVATRKSLEHSTTVVLTAIESVLSRSIPKLALTNREMACSLWGHCVFIINEFTQTSKKFRDGEIWARETADTDQAYEPFQVKLLNEYKTMESLVKCSLYFDFSQHYTYSVRDVFLDLFAHYFTSQHTIYEPIAPIADGNTYLSTNESSSDSIRDDATSDDDILDDSFVYRNRTSHRNRISASQGNVFRNSVLGDYESNTSDMEDDIEELSDIAEEFEVDEEDNGDESHPFSSHIFSDNENVTGESASMETDEETNFISEYELDDTMDDEEEGHYQSDFGDDDTPEIEIELILSGQDDRDVYGSDGGSEEDLTENPFAGEIDNNQVGFSDTIYPSIATNDGEIMLLYGERGALQLLDEVEAELEDLSHEDGQSRLYYPAYVNQALSTCSVEAYGEYDKEDHVELSYWDSVMNTNKDRRLSELKLFDSVAALIEQTCSESHLTLNNYDKEKSLKDMISSAEFSLLNRKESFVKDENRTRSIMTQVVAAISRLLYSYMSTKTHELEILETFFSEIARKGLGQRPITNLLSQLLESSNDNTEETYVMCCQAVSGNSWVAQGTFVHKAPRTSSSALVCLNLLHILNGIFADASKSRGGAITERSKLAGDILEVHGSDLIALVASPLISQNRNILEEATHLINTLISLLPPGREFNPAVDHNSLARFVHVLGSKEISSAIFSNITDLLSTHLHHEEVLPSIIKEVRRSKNCLISLLSKFSSVSVDETYMELMNALIPEEVRMLRLLSVQDKLYSGNTAITALRKVNFLSLWQISLEHLTTVRRIQIVGTVASLALLEIIAIPANFMKNEQDTLNMNDLDLERNESEESENFTFVNQMVAFLKQKLSQHRPLINELLCVKPKLIRGALGKLALNYDILNLEGKELLLSSDLDIIKDEHSDAEYMLHIDRFNAFETSMMEVNKLSPTELKCPINIAFNDEIGEDAGGLAREWLEILGREISNPDRGLFCATAAGSSIQQINPSASSKPGYKELFRFVGRILGRALYDRRTINLHFSRAIYRFLKWNDVRLQDMEAVDEEYFRSLSWMLNNDITDVLFETFSIESENSDHTKVIVDLIPNGRNVSVTEANKLDYVKAVVDHKLIESVRPQLEALRSGFYEVLSPDLMKIFDAQELELLVTGLPSIDIDDWHRNTTYSGYTSMSPQARWFWIAVRSFNDEERAKLLQFCTGTSRVPTRGFSQLESNTGSTCFQIIADNESTDRLPTAHTCMNQLALPRYKSYEQLRRLLLLAVMEGFEGFGFA